MLFVEVFRGILVIFGALVGLEVGRTVDRSPAPVLGMVVGALVAYLIGGLLGRLLARQRGRAMRRFDRVPPGELFAGTLTGIAGLLLGIALCLPLFALWHSEILFPLVAAVAWVCAWYAFRVGTLKGRQVVSAAGLTRILAPPTEPPPGFAFIVDPSAVMDRSLLVLGRAGLLVGGLVVPQFVLDQVQTLAAGPDPVSSRRARRGLESLEVLRERGVTVHVAPDELPDIDDPDERLLETARRLGLRLATCSGPLEEAADERALPVTDLRHLATDLAPDHAPGERLQVDLVKAGNQARQAVGYLDDGDMVVVSDAQHLIGRDSIDVEVLSTTRTNQGTLVFARLDSDPQAPGRTDPGQPPAADGHRGGRVRVPGDRLTG
ncbi:MAG TPA: hypothetical protein VKG43_00810 [Acidimicrobiales bacterium]|nr:hypothetical protein [Acidimicrobiales bacterium]